MHNDGGVHAVTRVDGRGGVARAGPCSTESMPLAFGLEMPAEKEGRRGGRDRRAGQTGGQDKRAGQDHILL